MEQVIVAFENTKSASRIKEILETRQINSTSPQ